MPALLSRSWLPSLQEGQTVVMDNVRTLQGARVRQAIEARGCRLWYLPSYSPDFSPIEQAFSRLKACLRRIGARCSLTRGTSTGGCSSFRNDYGSGCSWLVYPLRLSCP